MKFLKADILKHLWWIIIQGLFLYNLNNNNTFEFHLHVQGLQRTFKNHVSSISVFHIFAHTSTCHSILSLKFTSDCLIFLRSNKYQWNKRWTNRSWRWRFAVNLWSIESIRTKHHLDQREAWEPRKYSCGARRKGADYNKHQQDWCRKLYLYSIQWLW